MLAEINGQETNSAFRSAMQQHGIDCRDEIIPDGELHRFRPGDRKNPDGWYCLHVDGIPAGSCGDWKTGESFVWSAKKQDDMTQDERAEFRRRIEAQKQRRDVEQQQIREKARQEALKIWEAAQPASTDHPYLERKQVKPHGVKVDEQGRLVVPGMDAAGTIHTLQRIRPDGVKRFLSGGKVHGHFFVIPGDITTVYICEGYATAASIHEATGALVVIAFNAGNIGPVTKIIKEKYAS